MVEQRPQSIACAFAPDATGACVCRRCGFTARPGRIAVPCDRRVRRCPGPPLGATGGRFGPPVPPRRGAPHECDAGSLLAAICYPGDMLAYLICRVTGFAAREGCGCRARREQMNTWGWVGCWRHRRTIVSWLAAAAKKAGVECPEATLAGLLRAAWRERHLLRSSAMSISDAESDSCGVEQFRSLFRGR